MANGARWEEYKEVFGVSTSSEIKQLCDLGELTIPLCALIPSLIQQVQVHRHRHVLSPKGSFVEY